LEECSSSPLWGNEPASSGLGCEKANILRMQQ
jgi:hypothetical protein